jgi:Holliday junction resolvasome RuvABC endonuclease subunit
MKDILLTIDLAFNHLGFAVFDLKTEELLWSEQWHNQTKSKTNDREEKINKFSVKLRNIFNVWNPRIISYELPNAHYNTIRNIFNLEGILLNQSFKKCQESAVQFYASTIKKAVTGYGRTQGTEVQDTVEKKYRMKCDGPDQADAIGIGITFFMNRKLNQ